MMKETNTTKPYPRKQFLMDGLKLAGAASFLPIFADTNSHTLLFHPMQFTVQDIIDIIVKEVPGAPFKETVDTIKAGNAKQEVTGIVTTMFPTVDVINKTAALHANFIIAHEPSFYNHPDDKNFINKNEVLAKKLALLEKHGITIWRFHDYCHALIPDIVSYGFAKKTGWLPYFKAGDTNMKIPPTSLENLIRHLKQSLQIKHLKFIGEPEKSCEKIAVFPGAWGGQKHMTAVEEYHPDVLIVGELSEWETAEYIRDAKLLGSKTALIVLGHAVSEEPGMEWLPSWLKPKLPDMKITHIPSGDPFSWA
jgi:putative NIF3 family GTP cyclohydrolase 1 type 2